MDIPYGFDCYTFQRNEIKYFEPKLHGVRRAIEGPEGQAAGLITTYGQADFIKFTRKNEDYPREQIIALGRANRLNMSETSKRIFCGIKIQIGIGVVTNFMRLGMQYKPPIRGRSELVNGSWTGIMKGLTIENTANASYDLAFGNFLAWDEEFPYIKFGPFFAVESKLVFLTGSSRRIETSSFGTNIRREIWLILISLLALLSVIASLHLAFSTNRQHKRRSTEGNQLPSEEKNRPRAPRLMQDFFFIYFTMLLNKPSVEFDDFIWPKPRGPSHASQPKLPTSIRTLSYLWSAACLVIASIYSGEMLAVMLLHADQNIDTIAQLINSRPQIEPVIRQDDLTYNLMLKSLDANMLRLHNLTRIIPRADVYTRQFIESVSERKVALLGDDELIDTIYDLYHKYYPLYKSKTSYLQYPISIMYRREMNATMEDKLRRGMIQMFEMGLVHRWFQAQKDTYIQFYDKYERNKTSDKNTRDSSSRPVASATEEKYKPLSRHHFSSFFRAMLYCNLFAFLLLVLELLYSKIFTKT